jgi:hypothetical protein
MSLQNLIAASRISYSQLFSLRIRDLLYSSVALNFNMQPQTQSNWCWAATSTSVSVFYSSLSPWTQCKVANGELGYSNCCNSPVPSPCNVGWYLDKALTRTENLVTVTGPATFDQVRSEIQAGRPVGARIGWSGGGGHFMCIYGCDTIGGTEYFDIDDPIFGKNQPTVATFSSSYQGSGSWTHTYYTKRAPYMINIKALLLEEYIIRPIWEARPILQLKLNAQQAAQEQSGAALAVPHYVYNMGLDQLRGNAELPSTPVALRVLEVHNDKTQAMFELEAGTNPKLRNLTGPGPQLDLLDRGLSQIANIAAQGNQEAELRLLQVPALYVDALWLHFENAANDVFVTLRSPGVAEPFRAYPAKEFLSTLAEHARSRTAGDSSIAP